VSALQVLREDYALDSEQVALRESFAGFLDQYCPLTLAREAGPDGFDAQLWRRLSDLGAIGIAVPAEADGAGGGLVEIALVVEELGRRLAPVPLIEAVVAARALAGPADGAPYPELAAVLDGSALVGLALAPVQDATPQAVAAGQVANWILAEHRGEFVRLSRPPAPEPHDGPRRGGSGWLALPADLERTVLARGSTARAVLPRMRREWGLLTAAALIGLAQGALDLAVRYAGQRHAFGAPIGTFQAVSHPLADAEIAVTGGRRLVHKAAWHAERERDRCDVLVSAALLHARRTADRTAALAVHVHGGIGLSLESDVHLYFSRAKLWPAPAGDPDRALTDLADALFERAPSGAAR
jgi:alkylation response protein AidB-like acyl-CoA dehydrogenase